MRKGGLRPSCPYIMDFLQGALLFDFKNLNHVWHFAPFPSHLEFGLNRFRFSLNYFLRLLWLRMDSFPFFIMVSLGRFSVSKLVQMATFFFLSTTSVLRPWTLSSAVFFTLELCMIETMGGWKGENPSWHPVIGKSRLHNPNNVAQKSGNMRAAFVV